MALSILHKKNRPLLVAGMVLLVILTGIIAVASYLTLNRQANAASTKNFNPGTIISQSNFTNNKSMTAAQIQTFLNQKKSACLKDYKGLALIDANKNGQIEDWTAAEQYGGPTKKQTMTAAQLIKAAADTYGINPQVLLVTLEKEQGLVTRSDCPQWRYNTAFGFGCPDTAPCDTAAYGFTRQLDNAAYHFKNYMTGKDVFGNIVYSTFKPGKRSVLYHPNSSCGSSSVTITNEATAALYTYTPYQPNQASLNAGYGTGNSCSSYGNRNFHLFYTDWFGSPYYSLQGRIGERYKAINGKSSLGDPKSDEITLDTGGKYQEFEKGRIYWTKDTGAWEVKGHIGNRYKTVRADSGPLGYPISNEKTLPNGFKYQEYQNGRIYWKKNLEAYNVSGRIGAHYLSIKAHSSRLGAPISNEIATSTGGRYQQFERGRIYWTKDTEAWDMGGKIGARYYSELAADASPLGNPVSRELTIAPGVKYQEFENGRIYWSSKTGARSLYGKIGVRYMDIKAHESRLGLPTSNELKTPSGGRYQQFERGRIYWTKDTEAWDMGGKIGARYYNELSADTSPLGNPTGGEITISPGVKYQEFEGGRIYWSNDTGARSIYGKIGQRYIDMNTTSSRLGLPVSNELGIKSGGRYQQFQNGRIVWSSSTGAWDMGGKIGKLYIDLKSANGVLGHPTSAETRIGDAIVQQFKNGSITYKNKKATHKVN